MTQEFLLQKDKNKGNPPHIQAHLALPDTKANASQSQKSLHFAVTPKPTHHPYITSSKQSEINIQC